MSRSGALFCNVGQFTWWLRAAVKHLGTDSPIITANALQIIPLRKSCSIPWRTWRGSGSQGQWLRRQRSYRQPSPKQQVSRWQLLVSTCIGAVACLQFLHLIYFRRAWLLARTKICRRVVRWWNWEVHQQGSVGGLAQLATPTPANLLAAHSSAAHFKRSCRSIETCSTQLIISAG